jgi:hypothetical protein
MHISPELCHENHLEKFWTDPEKLRKNLTTLTTPEQNFVDSPSDRKNKPKNDEKSS